eukprot:COSAG01_NODE_800_length_13475_cov_24.171725_5_plen_71_part_00
MTGGKCCLNRKFPLYVCRHDRCGMHAYILGKVYVTMTRAYGIFGASRAIKNINICILKKSTNSPLPYRIG